MRLRTSSGFGGVSTIGPFFLQFAMATPLSVATTPTGVPLGRIDTAVNANNVWKALFELSELLRAACNAEDAYQAYFERNPIVFEVLGYDAHSPFEQSSGTALPFDADRNFRPEPDFLCASRNSGTLTVFELKTPFVKKLITARSSDGNRAKLRAYVDSHVAQAKDYVGSIQGNAEARRIVRDALNLERIGAYEITLVCGLASKNDTQQVTQILARSVPPVRVLYFDTLLDLLAAEYARQHHGVESRLGWSCIYHLGLPEAPSPSRKYIMDAGAKAHDRISFIRAGNQILCECLDSTGRLHHLAAPISPGVHYVLFEFSTDEQGIYLSLHVDDEQQGLTLGRTQFQCDPDMSNYVFGADLDGGHGAEFDVFQSLFVNNTLSLEHKLGMYGYVLEKRALDTGHLHYYEESFMRLVPEGALVQPIEAFKPFRVPEGIRIGRINSKVPDNAPKPRISAAAGPGHRRET